MHGCVRALVSSVQYCHFSLGYFFLFLCTVICFLDLLLFIPSLSPFLLSSFLPLKKILFLLFFLYLSLPLLAHSYILPLPFHFPPSSDSSRTCLPSPPVFLLPCTLSLQDLVCCVQVEVWGNSDNTLSVFPSYIPFSTQHDWEEQRGRAEHKHFIWS